MESSSEKTTTNNTQAISRRRFLDLAAKAVVVVGAVATGAALYRNIDRLKEYEDSHSVEKLIEKPIPGEEIKDRITKKYPGYDLIIVRKDPLQSDSEILGYADPGQKVKAEAVYGVPYASYDNSLGGPFMVDGEGYGKWFKINGSDLIVHDKNGKIIQTKDRSVYMAGNFLPEVEEISNAQ